MASEFKQLLDFRTYHYFPIPEMMKEKYKALKNINYIHFSVSFGDWDFAKSYAKCLSIGGFKDWKLPFDNYDKERYGHEICYILEDLKKYIKKDFDIDLHDEIFSSFPDDFHTAFWTNTEEKEELNKAYVIWIGGNADDFCGYLIDSKENDRIIICVR